MSSQAIGQRFMVSRGGCWQCGSDCRSRLAEVLTFSSVAYNEQVVALVTRAFDAEGHQVTTGKMSDYNKFRKVIIDLCKQKRACEGEFRKLIAATDMPSLTDVLKANFHWCCNNEVLTGDIIDTYGLAEYGIRHNVDASGGYLLAWGNAKVEASGSATVRASGNAKVEARGSATVEASGSATVRAWGSATVRASDSAYIHAPYGAIECKLSGQAILRHNGVIKSATSEMKLP